MNAQTRPARNMRDLLVVDLHGMKPALVAQARAERVSVSVLVRRAVARELDLTGLAESGAALMPAGPTPTSTSTSTSTSNPATVKLSIRLTAIEAQKIAAHAQAAGLSRGAYLAGLTAGIPVLSDGTSRNDHVRALTASSAELATLNRNIHHLSTLLSRGASKPAMQYREMLATLAGDVRGHLRLASVVLARLQPAKGSSPLRWPA